MLRLQLGLCIDHDGSSCRCMTSPPRAVRRISAVSAALEKLGLLQLTKLPVDFSPATATAPSFARAAFSAADLYEIIFPNEAVPAGERPDWLLNVTTRLGSGFTRGPISICAGARDVYRARTAAGARRQYRHFRRGRSTRPHHHSFLSDRGILDGATSAADRPTILCKDRRRLNCRVSRCGFRPCHAAPPAPVRLSPRNRHNPQGNGECTLIRLETGRQETDAQKHIQSVGYFHKVLTVQNDCGHTTDCNGAKHCHLHSVKGIYPWC